MCVYIVSYKKIITDNNVHRNDEAHSGSLFSLINKWNFRLMLCDLFSSGRRRLMTHITRKK